MNLESTLGRVTSASLLHGIEHRNGCDSTNLHKPPQTSTNLKLLREGNHLTMKHFPAWRVVVIDCCPCLLFWGWSKDTVMHMRSRRVGKTLLLQQS